MSATQDSTRKWHREYVRRWRKRNPELAKAIGRKAAKIRREKYPMATKAQKKASHLKRSYGLTLESFASLLRGQGNKCAICATLDGDWVVDHDHKTGTVRGILCRQCNMGLGCFKDSPVTAMNAAKYLLVQ